MTELQGHSATLCKAVQSMHQYIYGMSSMPASLWHRIGL